VREAFWTCPCFQGGMERVPPSEPCHTLLLAKHKLSLRVRKTSLPKPFVCPSWEPQFPHLRNGSK
jgi:hypothetical protein